MRTHELGYLAPESFSPRLIKTLKMAAFQEAEYGSQVIYLIVYHHVPSNRKAAENEYIWKTEPYKQLVVQIVFFFIQMLIVIYSSTFQRLVLYVLKCNNNNIKR